jgi:hypothetical protein
VGFAVTDLNLNFYASKVPVPEDAHVQQAQQQAQQQMHAFWQQSFIVFLD